MAVHLANKSLVAIEEQIQSDQGALYRKFLGQVIPSMGDAYSEHTFPFRSHLGASGIGDECARKIWYGFRWATEPKFGGRLLRLFNRGHLEEARFIAMLLAIGVEVYQQDADGNQFRISDAGGHFGGSGDGVGIGLPELEPGVPALLEFKTAAEKSFTKTKKLGVYETKFEHYVQMQVYMRKMGISVALYMVVNKNNDELYAELVPFNADIADQYINRGVELVWYETEPKKLSETPGWFACKWCDHRNVCHLKKAPSRNCRTCRSSVPQKDGTWKCTNFDSNLFGTLTKEQQLENCSKYERKF